MEVLVALIQSVALVIAAWFAWRASNNSKQARINTTLTLVAAQETRDDTKELKKNTNHVFDLMLQEKDKTARLGADAAHAAGVRQGRAEDDEPAP